MFGNLASALRKKNYLLRKTQENFFKKTKKISKKAIKFLGKSFKNPSAKNFFVEIADFAERFSSTEYYCVIHFYLQTICNLQQLGR
jgi:hypothetical protein